MFIATDFASKYRSVQHCTSHVGHGYKCAGKSPSVSRSVEKNNISNRSRTNLIGATTEPERQNSVITLE